MMILEQESPGGRASGGPPERSRQLVRSLGNGNRRVLGGPVAADGVLGRLGTAELEAPEESNDLPCQTTTSFRTT
jgi:hypothetical protein